MMRCMVIDDEQLVRELLEDNIRQVPFLQWVRSCRNALEATEALQETPVDLLFLDIQMPRLNGLQFLQTLTDPPLVILVSAYEQYALEGFDLRVVDYLLKPFSFERFLKACARAHEMFRFKQNDRLPSAPVEDFFVNVEYALVKVSASDILYIEGVKDYVKIYLASTNKPVLTRMTLKALEEKLLPPAFVRTHKSYLVSVKKITSVKRDLICIGNTEIPISVSYKSNITRLLK